MWNRTITSSNIGIIGIMIAPALVFLCMIVSFSFAGNNEIYESESMIIDYQLVTGHNKKYISKQVIALIKDGWYLHGEAQISSEHAITVHYCQTMVKYQN